MSVRLLQTGIVSKLLDESSWVLAWWLYFTYFTLYFKENMGISKIRVLPSRALSETSQSENFPAASLSRCQQNSSSSTVELVDNTYTTIDDESWLFTTCRPTVTLWLRCCDFFVDSSYNCFYSWQDFDWQRVAWSVYCSRALKDWTELANLANDIKSYKRLKIKCIFIFTSGKKTKTLETHSESFMACTLT